MHLLYTQKAQKLSFQCIYAPERKVIAFPIDNNLEVRLVIKDDKVGYDYKAGTIHERTVKLFTVSISAVTNDHIGSWVKFVATGKY